MSEPFIGEIRIFGFNWNPRNWALCNGQLLAISQNTALFAIIGTQFGGDGRTTMGLPYLQGRAPMHAGNGPGLTPRPEGSFGGGNSVQLAATQIPAHTHTIAVDLNDGTVTDPLGCFPAKTPKPTKAYAEDSSTLEPMNGAQLGAAGASGAHENRQPYLTVNFCIALQGLFPSRN